MTLFVARTRAWRSIGETGAANATLREFIKLMRLYRICILCGWHRVSAGGMRSKRHEPR